jgi:HAD superfamily hydrolase (TIGR01509 family)
MAENTTPTFKAVIFDMDGLMFDTETLFFIAEDEVAKKYGKTFTLDVQVKMMGQKGVHAIETMCAELGITEDPEKVMRERDEKYIELLRTRSEPMHGLVELLNFLDARGIHKAIATSSHREWVDILLARANITDRFPIIVTGQDVKVGKPDPEIYLKAIELLHVPAHECLVLEDAINGIRAGKAAGCTVVAVPDKHTAHQDFSEADHVVTSLADERLKTLLSSC